MELMSELLPQTLACLQFEMFKIKRGKNFAMTPVYVNQNF